MCGVAGIPSRLARGNHIEPTLQGQNIATMSIENISVKNTRYETCRILGCRRTITILRAYQKKDQTLASPLETFRAVTAPLLQPVTTSASPSASTSKLTSAVACARCCCGKYGWTHAFSGTRTRHINRMLSPFIRAFHLVTRTSKVRH